LRPTTDPATRSRVRSTLTRGTAYQRNASPVHYGGGNWFPEPEPEQTVERPSLDFVPRIDHN